MSVVESVVELNVRTEPTDVGPGQKAIQEYGEHVWSLPAEPDMEILRAADKFRSQFHADVATYRKRLAALEDLAKADELQAEANAIVVPAKVEPGDVLLDSLKTVDDLVLALGATGLLAPMGFVAAVAPAKEWARQQDLLQQAANLRVGAQQVLLKTAPPLERNPVHDALRVAEADLAEIGRQEAIGKRIQKIRTTLNKPREEWDNMDHEKTLVGWKATLAALKSQFDAKRLAAARGSAPKREKRIAKLRQEVASASAKAQADSHDAKNMLWAADKSR